jgi:hypothetical protein
LNPEDAKQQYDQATAWYQEKRYAEALELLDELDAVHPMTQNIMYPRALCLAAMGRAEEALQLCEQLEMMFQDARTVSIKAQLQMNAPAEGAATPSGAARKPLPRPAAGFPWVNAVIVALVIALVGAGAYFYMLRGGGSGKRESTISNKGEVGEGSVAGKMIDQAMQTELANSDVPPFTSLWDTNKPSPTPLTSTVLTSQTGWTEVGEDQTDYRFQGDAVLMNNQVMLVLRKAGGGAELCGRTVGKRKIYATLVPGGPAEGGAMDDLKIVGCAQDTVILEATYSAGGALRYELELGKPFVKVAKLGDTAALRVVASSRFAVLPDFFADDIVIDGRAIPVDSADLPSENFLLHMMGDGEAIVMDVWENRDQDVRIELQGKSGGRTIESAEIDFGDEGEVWVALLAETGIWHMRDIALNEKGYVLPLYWRWPFPALWRVDWRRADKLTDSWEMMTETTAGEFKKHGLFEEDENAWTKEDWWGGGPRTRIASGLGRFNYPCWVDRGGQGWLEPLKTESWGGYQALKGVPEFVGPALLYPLNRIAATPLSKFTVVDVVRSTLGVGPCEYILDVEGQHEGFEGLPTCSVQDVLDDIYQKGNQIQLADQVEKMLGDVVDFIEIIRNRIDTYGRFSKEMQAFLDKRAKEAPEQRAFIEEMLTATRRIDTAIEARLESIKSVKYAAKLVKEFRSELADVEGAGSLERCQYYTKAWVEIGGNQDTLVAECRVAVKLLRQAAALSLTYDAGRADLVKEIRARTEEILRSPVNYEAPRH